MNLKETHSNGKDEVERKYLVNEISYRWFI